MVIAIELVCIMDLQDVQVELLNPNLLVIIADKIINLQANSCHPFKQGNYMLIH